MFLFLMAYFVLSSNVHISIQIVCNGLLHQVWGLVGERVVEKLLRKARRSADIAFWLITFQDTKRVLPGFIQCVSMNAVFCPLSFL